MNANSNFLCLGEEEEEGKEESIPLVLQGANFVKKK